MSEKHNDCPNVTACELHKLFVDAKLLGIWMERYCNTRPETCKRYVLIAQGIRPERSLLPNGRYLPVLNG